MAPERSYLDWNASAPVRPEAREALGAALAAFGNPSSVHAEGRAARALLDASREELARFMGCGAAEVVFTSGGTEANNLALTILAGEAGERAFSASRLEHPSVLRRLEALEADGWRARWLAVDERGVAEVSGIQAGGFACLQAANQETGALQPLGEFADACGALGVPWHCDAVQAWGRVRLSARELGAATASLSGHKLGAPKGIGALFVAEGARPAALLLGGPQERGRRGGTENVAGAAALAAACRAAAEDLERDVAWTRGLVERLVSAVEGLCPLALVNAAEAPLGRLPNSVSLSLPGLEGDLLVQALDLEGVAVSSGSACASGALEPSQTLTAMGLPPWRVGSSLRVSVGPTTRPEEVDAFLAALRRIVSRKS